MAELDRYIRRGGMYWVRSTDTWGCETASSRPGVVVSSQYGIDHAPVVTIVYCTSQYKSGGHFVELKNSDKPSYAICNQIFTVDKGRLGNKLCDTSEEEMGQIEAALARCLGLVIHTREIDVALDAAKAQVASLEEELMAKNVEIAMVEKMYDKALEMLAGVHLTKDLQKKPEPVKPRVPRIVEEEPEKDEEIESRSALRENDGKVNMNTAPAQEIRNRTNLPMPVVYSITSYRKQNGPFSSLEDLLKAPRFTEYHLREYGKMLTV